MSFGPELVWLWSRYFERHISRRVQKVEGADNWAAISFSGPVTLLLSWGAQNCGIASVSDDEKKALLSNIKLRPPIINALKSNLAGAELTGVTQPGRDRIIRLEFTKTLGAGFHSVKFLTLEVMERYSNLILTDESNIILETAKHIHPSENRFRSVLPAQQYVPPPVFNGMPLEEWLSAPSSDSIAKLAGFGKTLLNSLRSIDITTAEVCLSKFYREEPCDDMIPQRIGKYITVLPILLDGAETLRGGTIEETARMITLEPLFETSIGQRKKKISAHIEREILRRTRQTEDIERLLYDDNAEKYRRYGEILTANAWQIKPGSSEAEIKYWDANGLQKCGTIPIDPAMPPSKNAAVYFAKYKKITSARERASKLLEKVRQELSELNEQSAMLSCIEENATLLLMEEEMGLLRSAASLQKGRKKTGPQLPPHKRFDLGFALVYAGLSAKGNRYVTFKVAATDDIWFHVQGIPGSHVILRYNTAPNKESEELAVRFCASVAANFSKGRDNQNQRVDYTLRKYVSPVKGGLANVTYREFKSVAADPAFWKIAVLNDIN